MFPLKGLIDKALEQRIEDGFFFKEPAIDHCVFCKGELEIVPARLWGKDAEGYFMHKKHEKCGTIEEKPKELSTERRIECTHVVFVNGTPCFITKEEKEALLRNYERGVKISKIREYAVSLNSPMVPFDEYQEHQRRKNIAVEAQLLPFN